MMKNLQRGFTLIELLVVIAIIGILAAVVLASLNDARDGGADASAKTSMSNLRSQAEIFYNANNFSYTGLCTDGDIVELRNAANAQTGNTSTCSANATDYAASITLRSADVFCVDSTGFSGISSSAPTAEVCP